MNSFDVERFLEEIEKRRDLWDPLLPGFRNKQLRDNLWNEVGCKLYPGFQKLSVPEQLMAGKSLALKWKHIRDNYVRSLRLKMTGKDLKPYVYSENLHFLDETLNLKSSKSLQPQIVTVSGSVNADGGVCENVQNQNTDEDSFNANEESIDTNEERVDANEESVDGNVEKFIADEENFDADSSSADSEMSVTEDFPTHSINTSNGREKNKKQIKRKLEQEVENHVNNTQAQKMPRTEEFNDDMDFFRSLLPLMKRLPLSQKMKFRMDIMRTALQYSVQTENFSQSMMAPLPPFQNPLRPPPPPQQQQHYHNPLPSMQSSQRFFDAIEQCCYGSQPNIPQMQPPPAVYPNSNIRQGGRSSKSNKTPK